MKLNPDKTEVKVVGKWFGWMGLANLSFPGFSLPLSFRFAHLGDPAEPGSSGSSGSQEHLSSTPFGEKRYDPLVEKDMTLFGF